jgi:hypothetical protein
MKQKQSENLDAYAEADIRLPLLRPEAIAVAALDTD